LTGNLGVVEVGLPVEDDAKFGQFLSHYLRLRFFCRSFHAGVVSNGMGFSSARECWNFHCWSGSQILQVVNVRQGIIVVGIKAMHCLFHDIDSSDESYSHFAVWLMELLHVNNL
jgi:hypothetical protein